jgi:DNA-binding SARP family transcriptional activator
MTMESDQPGHAGDAPALEVRLLGPLEIRRGGVALALPRSRKVRALLAYLALSPHPVVRTQLCELLWDVPNDPRGELRWSLSKLRSILDGPGEQRRVESRADTIRLDLADCSVDAIAIARAVADGIEVLDRTRLEKLAGLFIGDFLEGLEIDRSPAFNGWLAAQRRRLRASRAAILEQLVRTAPDDEIFGHLEAWLALAPFDRRVHGLLLDALARHGRFREGDEHVAATIRLFEADGLDGAPIREAWRAARARADRPASVRPAAEAATADRDDSGPVEPRRASIAVMPFVDQAAVPGGPADGLAHDVITRLAKLRSLFVIAQGTVFALHERSVAPQAAGRMLNVDYLVSGSLRRDGQRIIVAVELAETRTGRVVWAETFDHRARDALAVFHEVGDRIVASVDYEIENLERNRAILRPPASLDAWEAHHRGLWHMYRFSKGENEQAQHFFRTAVRLDPTFARAHAGLSFTHFQNAFQGWADRTQETNLAFEAAGQSLMVDDRDPAAHWAMGRALWLRGHHDQALVELEAAVDLSPNFAIGHYTLAFVQSQSGDARSAIRSSDHSRRLSPYDPMLFGMLGARAMALARLSRFEEAAECGIEAAARPNAHAHIQAIAAYCLALADRGEEARAKMALLLQRSPNYRVEDFLTAMQFDPKGAALFREGARLIG